MHLDNIGANATFEVISSAIALASTVKNFGFSSLDMQPSTDKGIAQSVYDPPPPRRIPLSFRDLSWDIHLRANDNLCLTDYSSFLSCSWQDAQADYDDCGQSDDGSRGGDCSGTVVAGSGGNGSRSLWRFTSLFTAATLEKGSVYGPGEIICVTSSGGS